MSTRVWQSAAGAASLNSGAAGGADAGSAAAAAGDTRDTAVSQAANLSCCLVWRRGQADALGAAAAAGAGHTSHVASPQEVHVA